MYTFIYVLLCLETYALLTGSIGLFIALATIMYASLKINNKGYRLQ
nr:inner membrane CreD family protein [Muribaculum intestinale]